MSEWLDRGLALLKWPVAALAILALPGAGVALIEGLALVRSRGGALGGFGLGFVVYGLIWWWVLRKPGAGSFLSTLEHELTHALFAVLTLHRVTGLSATWSSGGHLRFTGRGNWLISTAPYFFPTVSVVLAAVLSLAPGALGGWASPLLGASLAYHLSSTWAETHGRQRDLSEVGWPFALAFLPAANLVVVGALLTHAAAGPSAALLLVRSVGTSSLDLGRRLFGL